MPTPINDEHRAIIDELIRLSDDAISKQHAVRAMLDELKTGLRVGGLLLEAVQNDWDIVAILFTPKFDDLRDAAFLAAATVPDFEP